MVDLSPYYDAAGARFGLSPAFVRAYAQAESQANPNAVGPLTRHGWRAQGAMQMAPATYAEMAKKHGLGGDPKNPADNVMAGAAYLRQLIDEFGPESETVALAWNAGPGYARQYLAGKKGMPQQTRELYGRIQNNLRDWRPHAGTAMMGAPAGGASGPKTPLPARMAAALKDPALVSAAGVAPVNFGGLLGGNEPPKAGGGGATGVMGLLDDDDAMTGALAALAPLTGRSAQPVSMGQVLAALGGGVTAGRQAGVKRRRDALFENMALAQFMGGQQEAAARKAAAAAYADKLEAAGQGELAAAVRANPDALKEIVQQQAKSAYPDALKPGDRFKAVGDALVDVTTGQPVYQGGEAALKAEKSLFDKEHTLRAGFDHLQPIKNFREVIPIYQSAVDAFARDNKAADLNIVYGLAKIMDPASVVRESEMEMAVKTGSPAESLMGLFNSIVGGSRLTEDQRRNLLQEATSRMQGHKSVYDQFAQSYGKMAADFGLDASRVVMPMPGLPAWPPAGSPAGPAVAPAAPPSPPAATPAPRAMLGGRIIVVQDGRWVFEDDGQPVPTP